MASATDHNMQGTQGGDKGGGEHSLGAHCALAGFQEKHLGWEHKGRHREVCAPSTGSDMPFLIKEIE